MMTAELSDVELCLLLIGALLCGSVQGELPWAHRILAGNLPWMFELLTICWPFLSSTHGWLVVSWSFPYFFTLRQSKLFFRHQSKPFSETVTCYSTKQGFCS